MDPETGRFMSMDTYGGSLTDPLSQNRYLFANSNPVKYRDPSGEFSLGEEETVCSISIILNGIAEASINCIESIMENSALFYDGNPLGLLNVVCDTIQGLIDGLLRGFVFGIAGWFLGWILEYCATAIIALLILNFKSICDDVKRIVNGVYGLINEDESDDSISKTEIVLGVVLLVWDGYCMGKDITGFYNHTIKAKSEFPDPSEPAIITKLGTNGPDGPDGPDDPGINSASIVSIDEYSVTIATGDYFAEVG